MAAEQPPASGQSVLGTIRSYAVLVALILVSQIILAFFIVQNVILARREDAGRDALAAMQELKGPEEEPIRSDKPASVVDIKEDILTNTAGTDRVRFLKVHVQLGVTPEKAGEEIGLIEPKVIDTIIGILSSKTVSELDDPADKELAKDEIKIALNKYLRQGEVVKVYLTSFLIQ